MLSPSGAVSYSVHLAGIRWQGGVVHAQVPCPEHHGELCFVCTDTSCVHRGHATCPTTLLNIRRVLSGLGRSLRRWLHYHNQAGYDPYAESVLIAWNSSGELLVPLGHR